MIDTHEQILQDHKQYKENVAKKQCVHQYAHYLVNSAPAYKCKKGDYCEHLRYSDGELNCVKQ